MAQQKNEVQSLLEKAMFQATVADFWMGGGGGGGGVVGGLVLPFQQSTVGKLVVCLMMQPCNVGR